MGRLVERVRGGVREREKEERIGEDEGAGERVASNIQLIIRQTFLMNEELPIPPSSLVSRHKLATRGYRGLPFLALFLSLSLLGQADSRSLG